MQFIYGLGATISFLILVWNKKWRQKQTMYGFMGYLVNAVWMGLGIIFLVMILTLVAMEIWPDFFDFSFTFWKIFDIFTVFLVCYLLFFAFVFVWFVKITIPNYDMTHPTERQKAKWIHEGADKQIPLEKWNKLCGVYYSWQLHGAGMTFDEYLQDMKKNHRLEYREHLEYARDELYAVEYP